MSTNQMARVPGVSALPRVMDSTTRRFVRPIARRSTLGPAVFKALAVVNAASRVLPPPLALIRARTLVRSRIRMARFEIEVVRPAGAEADWSRGAVLYIHGGGFISGTIASHRYVVTGIARRTGLPVVSVGYRQMPEVLIAESESDCLTAYHWLLEQGVDPARTVIAGDSAGGFMAFSTALAAAAEGTPAAGVVGLAAMVDLDSSARAAHPNAHRDPLGGLGFLRSVCELGAGSADGTIDPARSPINGALHTLPPTLLIVSDIELLLSDSERMAERLAAAGVPCDLHVWKGQPHAFVAYPAIFPECRAALDDVAAFVLERTRAEEARVPERDRFRSA